MNKKTTKDAIKKIAKREGKSEICEEMKKDILSVFLNSEIRCTWDRLFGAGRLPSLEEFIKVLSLEVVKDKIRNYGIVVQKAVLLFSVVKLFYVHFLLKRFIFYNKYCFRFLRCYGYFGFVK